LGGWLYTEVLCPPEDGHPSQYQLKDSAAARDRTQAHLVANLTLQPLDYQATRFPRLSDINDALEIIRDIMQWNVVLSVIKECHVHLLVHGIWYQNDDDILFWLDNDCHYIN